MSVKVTLQDNSEKIITKLNGNKTRALTAMGAKGVNLILWQMRQGYGAPIRKTGNLQRDVQYAVEYSAPDTVDIGNTLEYAPYVHEGTYRMDGRPYILDGLSGESHTKQLQAVAEQELKKGFT